MHLCPTSLFRERPCDYVPLAEDRLCRNAGDRVARIYIFQDDGTCHDPGKVPNLDIPKDRGASPDHDTLTNPGHSASMRFGPLQLCDEHARKSATQRQPQWPLCTPRSGPFLLCD